MSRNIGGILNVDGTKITKTTGLKEVSDSVSVEDNGTITLPTGVTGWLKAWTDAEYLNAYIIADGTVTLTADVSTNTAGTDSDGNLCCYDGGSGAVIKNRLGSAKTVSYSFKYS